MVTQLRQKLGTNSVVMVVSDGAQSVSSLPFPAVTLLGTFEASDFYSYFVSEFLH